MASHPPGSCCTTGTLHKGDPKGKFLKIDGGINAYLATPSEENAHKSVGVLFIPEVIGIYANSQLLADGFAAKGYTTLIPDVFNGDAIPLNKFPNVDLLSWVAKGFEGLWIGKPDLSALSGVSPYRDGHLIEAILSC